MKTTRLENLLRTAWDTTGGSAARRLLWSLWTNRLAVEPQPVYAPAVNLFNDLTSLDAEAVAEFAGLLTLPLDTRAALLRNLFITTGEWDRVDDDAHELFKPAE